MLKHSFKTSRLPHIIENEENDFSSAHQVWREVYTYDKNGNRISKTTPWGKIEYVYDAENRLVSKGRIAYTYDADGNLLTEIGTNKTAEYEYNGESRMVRSAVTDTKANYQIVSEYKYDAFGRRTLTKDTMRTLYDLKSSGKRLRSQTVVFQRTGLRDR